MRTRYKHKKRKREFKNPFLNEWKIREAKTLFYTWNDASFVEFDAHKQNENGENAVVSPSVLLGFAVITVALFN